MESVLTSLPRVLVPNRQDNLVYCYAIEELEKFAVKDGVLMAYSAYVDKEADAYIQENYYHWFVLVPDKKIAEGFQTEDEFREYIQTLGIQDPSWQTPNEAFDKFIETGCLDWMRIASDNFLLSQQKGEPNWMRFNLSPTSWGGLGL